MEDNGIKMVVEIYIDVKEGENKEDAYDRIFNALDNAGYENEFGFKVIETSN